MTPAPAGYFAGFPSASRMTGAPSPSSESPFSILARSPTTTQTTWSGWMNFAAAATCSGVSARTLPA